MEEFSKVNEVEVSDNPQPISSMESLTFDHQAEKLIEVSTMNEGTDIPTTIETVPQMTPVFSEGHLVKDETSINRIKTLNSSLDGQEHPVTGIEYQSKLIETPEAVVEGVFPEFTSLFDAQLSPENYQASDARQFRECNDQLSDWVESDVEQATEVFDEEQLDQILIGETPDGCTWHHNEEVGKMELVDRDVHDKTAHTGGKAVWGGGSECR